MYRIIMQKVLRAVEQNNIRISFEPHEKHIISLLFKKTKHADRFFNLVSPETVLKAWRNAVANYWSSFTKKRKSVRPPVTKEIKELILKFKKENLTWGSRRIRDELKNLFINVSHETISKIIQHHRKIGVIKPTLAWKRFLSSHWETLFACDSFTIDTFGYKRFYVFFIIEIKTRKIVQYAVTASPNIHFLRNQFSVFEYEHPEATLIHDNSSELKWFPYSQYNIKHITTVPYSPNMNAYAERFIRSFRQECLNFFIIFTYNQLYRIIKSYVDYYNNYRPHQGINGIPNGLLKECFSTGAIKQKPLVFGLHNHYYRQAA
jgi:transposase InsO family protein